MNDDSVMRLMVLLRSPFSFLGRARLAIGRRLLGTERSNERAVRRAARVQPRLARRLARHRLIRAHFLAVDAATWKCGGLYRAMEDHPRFDPRVVVHWNNSSRDAVEVHHETASRFEASGHRVIGTLDAQGRFRGTGIHGPGIVIHTNPHIGVVPVYFQAEVLRRQLPVYVPYMMGVYASESLNFGLMAYRLAWRNFMATPWHRDEYERLNGATSSNAVFVGYPNRDELLPACSKVKSDAMSRTILWGPHHSIDDSGLSISTFLRWHEWFLDAARRDEGLHFAFRPHPLLQGKLERLWGLRRAAEYWEAWRSAPSGSVSQGEHQASAFAQADALVHDSITFAGEWLIMERPAAFLLRDDVDSAERLNDLGREFLRGHHLVRGESDLTGFLRLVRSGEADPLLEAQRELVARYLPAPEFPTVGQAMLAEICRGLQIDF